MKKTIRKSAKSKKPSVGKKAVESVPKGAADVDEMLTVAAKTLKIGVRTVDCAADVLVMVMRRRIGVLTERQYAAEVNRIERKYGLKLTPSILKCVGEGDIELMRRIDKAISA